MSKSISWEKIFSDYSILKHDFMNSPFLITAEMIKKSVQHLKRTSEKEVRILCKIDNREGLPDIMRKNNLFILPIRNGTYIILKGEGFIDIPEISSDPIEYLSKINFELKSSTVGNSEMQHLDYCFAISMIKTFCNDESLVLTIRGRKYTPNFKFLIGNHEIEVQGVQTEVDAGYEGKDKIVLIEAKNSKTNNLSIRQLYYPFRQWEINTKKKVNLIFFEKRDKLYNFWEYSFVDSNNFNSLKLINAKRYIVKPVINIDFTTKRA
jgi:hypothetical protein